jgi:DNA-3-methyladenine glycosylase II
MSLRIDTEADLQAALVQLLATDSRLSRIYAVTGIPPLRRRAAGFEGLAAVVVAQQLSTASAGAIWGRLAAALDPFDHTSMARARPDRLRRLGLSAGKVRTLKAVARAIRLGALDLPALGACSAEDAHRALTAVHGIGPWTADIYLLSCLGHADAWPAGDLALQEACRLALSLRTRPTVKEMVPLAENWRPFRGVAARLLWTYYRTVKGRDGAPIQPQSPKRGP